jgi:hypothetical protein
LEKQALQLLPDCFEPQSSGIKKEQLPDIAAITAPLYQQIGQLLMELDY